MSSNPINSVVCAGLDFAWPDGAAVFTDLDAAFSAGRTGLIGRNGGGKSTLLKLVAGRLAPAAGTVTTSGDVAYLPQDLSLDTARTVADLLGIAGRRAALRAIEDGDADPAHFAAVGDDWDVEARAVETLHRFGVLPGAEDVLDRPVGTLSGGEAVLTGVAGLVVQRAAISLLDEPSNNLDRRAREVLYDAVADWAGVLIVVSHDRDLLERVDQLVELHDGAARTFGGPWSAYLAAIEAEQEAAARQVRAAEGEFAREKRQLIETQTKLARRERFGRRAQLEKRVPKIIAHARKRAAQVSAGTYRDIQSDRLAEARTSLAEAEDLVRDDDRIQVDLPDTEVPAGRDVLRLGDLTVRGPERIAVVGPNGSGKTTLFEALTGARTHPTQQVGAPFVPTRHLPQRLDVLDDGRSVLDNVRAAAPSATAQEARSRLARFLIRGDRALQLAGTLSGGERFRVSLACLLLAEPAPQLLLLDEPTNSLDLGSVEQLVSALRGYRGALVVTSHDEQFLAELGVTRRWEVAAMRLPREVVPPA